MCKHYLRGLGLKRSHAKSIATACIAFQKHSQGEVAHVVAEQHCDDHQKEQGAAPLPVGLKADLHNILRDADLLDCASTLVTKGFLSVDDISSNLWYFCPFLSLFICGPPGGPAVPPVLNSG